MRRTYGKTAERGYGGEHQRLRARWAPQVAAGKAWCHALICKMPARWIAPGTDWDLGHTAARDSWTGPEHASCNRGEGAARGNRARSGRQPGPVRRIARW